MNKQHEEGSALLDQIPAAHLLFGRNRRASYLFSTVGLVVGFLVPLEMFLFVAYGVETQSTHEVLVFVVSVVVIGAAMLNAYFSGGLLVSVGAVLFVPLRILLGHHFLQGNGVAAIPQSVFTAPTLVAVSVVAGLSAHAVGSIADGRVRNSG